MPGLQRVTQILHVPLRMQDLPWVGACRSFARLHDSHDRIQAADDSEERSPLDFNL